MATVLPVTSRLALASLVVYTAFLFQITEEKEKQQRASFFSLFLSVFFLAHEHYTNYIQHVVQASLQPQPWPPHPNKARMARTLVHTLLWAPPPAPSQRRASLSPLLRPELLDSATSEPQKVSFLSLPHNLIPPSLLTFPFLSRSPYACLFSQPMLSIKWFENAYHYEVTLVSIHIFYRHLHQCRPHCWFLGRDGYSLSTSILRRNSVPSSKVGISFLLF